MPDMEHLDDDTIQQWVEQTLEGEKAEAASAHLAACPACREQAEAYRNLFRELEGEAPGAPAGFFDEVMTAVGNTPRAARGTGGREGLWKAAGLGAAASVLLAVLFALDLPERGFAFLPGLTSGIADRAEFALPLPGEVDRAAEHAAAWAERGWHDVSSTAGKTLQDRSTLSFSCLGAFLLMGMMNLAAFWRLRGGGRSRAKNETPLPGRDHNPRR